MIDLDEERARMEAMLARRERMALGVTCTEMIELITRVRQAEKDAARYRWMIEHGGFGAGRWGKDWYLIFEGPAPEHAGEIDSFIDEDIKCIVE